ncbi:hypothetical protein [uncultured Desulfobulbus sp.]|uniref:hypothetical protein n=1 Tax=uncultured Desulfobulbus sp. TaxID=239745 RepID=UPI0029C891D8|nr:hypothetical protein [uncultured Desulfobulbus sp.]
MNITIQQIINFILEIAIPGFIGSGAAFLTVKFLSKSIIAHALIKDLEKFKIQLQEKTEYLKTSLAIFANEKDISYQRVDTQRAEAIHSIYQCICDTSFILSTFVVGPAIKSSPVEKHIDFYIKLTDQVNKSTTVMNETLRKKAIYFDNETYIMLNNYFTIAANTNAEFMKIFLQYDLPNITIQILEEARKKVERVFYEQLRPIHEKTVDSFRFNLGIEKEKLY